METLRQRNTEIAQLEKLREILVNQLSPSNNVYNNNPSPSMIVVAANDVVYAVASQFP